MKKLKLKIITPERLVLEEEVEQVSIPTTTGEITVLPDHVPLVSDLASGDIVAKAGNEDVPFALVGGFLEIRKDEEGVTNVSVLADFAEHVDNISEEEVEKARKRAQEIKEKMNNNEVVDFEHFTAELERSLTRVKIADKWRKRKYRK